MAKDKYSDDHTIEIVGDTKTLNVEDNLSVVGKVTTDDLESQTGTIDVDLTVGNDLTVQNDLNVFNDLSVTGEITASGDIKSFSNVSGDDFLFNNAKKFIRYVPLSKLQSGSDIRPGGGAVLTNSLTESTTSKQLQHTIGTLAIDDPWDFSVTINPYLINGSTVTRVWVLLSTDSTTGAATFGFDMDIDAVDGAESTPVAPSTLDSDTMSPVLTDAGEDRTWHSFSFNVDVDIDYFAGKLYSFKFQKTGSGATDRIIVNILACYIEMEVTDVNMALSPSFS